MLFLGQGGQGKRTNFNMLLNEKIPDLRDTFVYICIYIDQLIKRFGLRFLAIDTLPPFSFLPTGMN